MIAKFLRSAVAALTVLSLTFLFSGNVWAQRHHDADDFPTKTPIKHVVVIFQENISFDHYFATYPHATNPAGEPVFHPRKDTPRVNNLLTSGLLKDNPNTTQPFRLDRSQAVTCDQDHGYASEQKAFNHGLMDNFVLGTGEFNGTSTVAPFCNNLNGIPQNMVMGYFDGNTVTALWNYAQHFAMSDNSYSTQFGPSAVGALNLIAGNTNLGTKAAMSVPLVQNGGLPSASGSTVGNLAGGGTTGAVIGDPRPAFDACAPKGKAYVSVLGTGTGVGHDHIGDLLGDAANQTHGITWGWFQGGFDNCLLNAAGQTGLGIVPAANLNSTGDYISHHEPFLFYASTGNPMHLPPTGPIGTTDQAAHQYDITRFWTALANDQLPAVSFLKAPAVYDGHPGYSDPLDEQFFVVNTINKLEKSEEWPEIAVIILYDDSDGWYDHQMSPVIHQSQETTIPDDFLTDTGKCGVYPPPNPAETGPNTPPNGRCGFGPRQPLLVISACAKENYVDHRITDQASVTRFIEDNWNLGRLGGFSDDATAGNLEGMFDWDQCKEGRKVLLDPIKGEVTSESGGKPHDHDDRDDRRDRDDHKW